MGFVKDPSKMRIGEKMAREFLTAQIADPELRAKLTPTYRMGCKRVMLSNDYYPALTRDNVELVTEAIVAVEPHGVRTADGVLHELDVLICATGFYVTDSPAFSLVHGASGTLADAFRGDLDHYRGTSFPGYPNLFMLLGPNTELGHSSVLYMIESQLNYVVATLAPALRRGALVEPTAEAARAWTSDVRAKLPSTVWGTGCTSWYLNDRGVNTTIWPDFTFRFRRATRHYVAGDHQVTVAE